MLDPPYIPLSDSKSFRSDDNIICSNLEKTWLLLAMTSYLWKKWRGPSACVEREEDMKEI